MSEKGVFDIYKRNDDFKWKKNDVLKTIKYRHFLKGLVHGLCLKIEVFLIGVFQRNSIKNQRF